MDYFRHGYLPLGEGRGYFRQFTLLVLTRAFQIDWFKIPLLEEAKIAFRLGIKSWWGLPQVTPFWVCFCFITEG